MKIEKLKKEYFKGITKLVHQFKTEHGGHIPVDYKQKLESILSEILKSETVFVFIAVEEAAFENTEVLGYVSGHYCPDLLLFSSEIYVSDLVVDNDHRGKGIGRKLMEVIDKKAGDLGCGRIMLNTRKTAEAYKREFYPKNNFVERIDFANLVKPIGTK